MKVEAHIRLDTALCDLRNRLGVQDDYIFKHVHSVERTRNEFIATVVRCPVVIHVGVVDRSKWLSGYVRMTNSVDRLLRVIADHFEQCEDSIICGQRLLVDSNRSEKKIIQSLSSTLRRSNREIGRASFKNVVARPDHRTDAALVQVADMFAGLFRSGVAKPDDFNSEVVRVSSLN